MKTFHPNKSHGHDILSIRMFKLCGESIYKPLNLTFKSCLETSQFPSEWKKGNVVPVFKKGGKQLVKMYRPIFLAITGAISGTPKKNIYQELGLESLQQRRWYRKLCLFLKIYKRKCLKYLFNIIPQTNCQYRSRNAQNIPHVNVKHQSFFKIQIFHQPWKNETN